MLESFLEAPNILTDDDVMEFLTCIFRQPVVLRSLRLIIENRKKAREAEFKREIEAEAEEDP